MFGRAQLWGGGSPVGVWGRWRSAQAWLAPAGNFAKHGLDDVFERYPGKQDRQIIVSQCLRNVIAAGVAGVVAEFGSFRGHTAVQLLETMLALDDGSPLYLFDSFQGMPASDHPGDSCWRPGDMTASFQEVRARFEPFPQVTVVQGFFSDVLGSYDLRVKLAHIDADLYKSIRDVNAWLLDRVERGGMVVYDDYGFPTCEGALAAVNEAFKSRSEFTTFTLPTGQFLAIRR